MNRIDGIGIHDDENKPVRMHATVDQARVQHYSDVIDHMAKAAVDKYVAKHKKQPRPSQVAFLKKELTRYAVIRKDVKTASELTISDNDILNEQVQR